MIGQIIDHHQNGLVLVDVLRPQSMAGYSFESNPSDLKEVPREAALVEGTLNGIAFKGTVIEEMQDGHRKVAFTSPASLVGQQHIFSTFRPHRPP